MGDEFPHEKRCELQPSFQHQWLIPLHIVVFFQDKKSYSFGFQILYANLLYEILINSD